MITPIRTQRRYDHRLRELVRSTGDMQHAIQRGVPRSTARGWLNAARFDVVTIDAEDEDVLRLQQEVLAVRSATTFCTFLREFSPPELFGAQRGVSSDSLCLCRVESMPRDEFERTCGQFLANQRSELASCHAAHAFARIRAPNEGFPTPPR